ncbi:PREDICTED: LOW QUALITY PROTEIN: uncharacterized protein C17orf102 homolog, partial [Propithecus coquereli]|uniref:LOW QUALITY PROTEIN: uncharacterized protein C17orf102 homolog n=1 Tax=Propithecus coquereli TaxID=379532 RepID=UPI00063F33CC
MLRFSRVDATAVTEVPFQRMHTPHRAPEVFCSRSARGTGRGHPTPTPRVCVGLWGRGEHHPGCGAQLLSARTGSRAQLGAGWVWGAAGGDALSRGRREAERRGRAFFHNSMVNISNITGIVGTTASKTELALVLM